MVQCLVEVQDLYLVQMSRLALGLTQPPIKWVQEAISPGLKEPGHDGDHSPFSVEVKNVWYYALNPPS
jgi:hypothetical protein